MKFRVDQDQRYAKMRAHTATHILHAELLKIFPDTKQAGSMVDIDYARFDFQANRILSEDEIYTIEKNIQQYIYDAIPVEINEMNKQQAENLEAKAFFEDKYGNVVRVVSITDLSIELCGGTHVQNTKDIGAFIVVGQEAVASGIRRISIYTGPKVLDQYHKYSGLINQIGKELGVKNYNQVSDKLNKELKEKKELLEKVEGLETKLIFGILKDAKSKKNKKFEKILNISEMEGLNNIEFKNIVLQAKKLFYKDSLIYNNEGNFAIISKSGNAKDISNKLGLKGGGNEILIQGRDAIRSKI